MSCNDIPSLLDLQKAKLNADDFGRLMGTGTGTSTNGVTGQVRPTYNKVITNLGIERIGDFTTGCTVTARNQGVLEVGGSVYVWLGVIPVGGKIIPPVSTPASTGGIGPNGWLDIGDASVRSTFTGPNGFGLDGFYGGGGWTGVDAGSGNFYDNPNHTSLNALRQRWQVHQGEATDPVFWWQKTSSANVADGWEQGNQYNSLIKVGGTAFGCAGTDYVQYDGGSGDIIARHCRAHLNSAGAAGFALWAYTKVTNPLASRVAGAEISINNGAIQPSWIYEASGDPVGIGALTALNLGVADGSYGIHHAIRIPNKGASDLKRPWTGILMGQNSIMPADANGNGEAIRLRGASFTSGRYGAIALGDDTGAQMFSYGIRSIHSDFSNNALIWAKLDQKIVWGTDKAGTSYITWDTGLDCMRVGRTGVAVNNSKVLGGRVTGFARMTGTPLKTSFNADTATLQQVAQRLKAIEDALHSDSGHGLYGLT